MPSEAIEPTTEGTAPPSLYLAWVIAAVGTAMSLFFGEVMGLPPCTLCWYQRICLYPLVVLLAVGIVRRDDGVVGYALPLVIAGLAIAIYHNLVYYGVIPEALTPCSGGVSCREVQIEWLGFITIPMMALGAFAAQLAILLFHRADTRRSQA